MDNKQGTSSASGSAEKSAAEFMAELFQKFGGAEKAMEAFAMFAMGKTVPAAPTSTVTQPEAVETPPTAEQRTVPETAAIVPEETTAAQDTVPETTTEPEVDAVPAVPDPIVAEIREVEADLAAGLNLLAVSEPRLGSVSKGETPVLKDGGVGVSEGVDVLAAVVEGVSEGETSVTVSDVEGETPVLEASVEVEAVVDGDDVEKGGEALISEKDVEGETLEVVGGGEALISEEDVDAGKTPEKSVGTEAQLEENLEGIETPVYIAGATPLLTEEGGALDSEGAQGTVDAELNMIVDLTKVPEEADSPLNPREARRQARRSILDDIDETIQQKERETLGLETAASEQEDSPRPSRRESKEEERRTIEKKRKGKQIASSSTKKARGKFTESPLPPPAKVPYATEPESPARSSNSEEEQEKEQEEELNFEPTEIWITKELLDDIGKFDDPKRAAVYKEKSAEGKVAKSGKMYHPAELKHISSNNEFRGYIDAIGFDWLLKHSTLEVPVDLAREFFSTFRFKSTADLDAESINFRLFNEEHRMSIREWTLRMGLLTRTEDDEGLWDERMVGPPKLTPGFKAQSAWEFLTHPRVGQFKTSFSKAHHIENRVLRFAQTFISYNLMGTANNALTTADLYFTWCMATGVRVHLGYWLAQACHQVTSNPSRHLYTCHLLGAYLQRNVIMKINKACREVKMCSPPEVFNIDYFFNKGLLITRGKEVCFYEVGKSEAQIKQEPDVMEVKDQASEDEVRKMVEEVKNEVEEVRKGVDGVRKEMTEIRREFGKSREEAAILKGRITDLVAASTKQSNGMAEGVALMMSMMKWLRRKFPDASDTIPGSSGDITTPGQGSVSAQKPPGPRPHTTPSSARPVTLRTTVPRPKEDKPEKPELPARKKAKVTQPMAPPKSGSHGGQTPN